MPNKSNYQLLKKQALERYFRKLNDAQREAVFTVRGPVLILAGAGSGKTTVIINRIANMINFGNAYYSELVPEHIMPEDLAFLKGYADGKVHDVETLKYNVAIDQIKPWSILAITFTNKAANELRERLGAMLGEQARDITAATFHSACVRILRREIEALGYTRSFAIYDSDDSKRTIKDCMTRLNISDKMFPVKSVQSAISRAKDSLIEPAEFTRQAGGDYRLVEIAKIYTQYQKSLKNANALDFDDIIMLTVRLFEQFPDVLEHYRNLYKYILVDEYQDTNHAQYKLVRMLAEKHKNLCVVGDDDQSIYRFRGATIENILSFEEQFESVKVIRLEENYRSTQNILSAANSVISNNHGRKGKTLWTGLGDGEKICITRVDNEDSEAAFVAGKVLEGIKAGKKYSDFAVLYRMNAQSRNIEQGFIKSGIPYRIIGGLRFFERKEIKDLLAYLSVVNNPFDMLRFKRIINEPKRGLGDATVAAIEEVSTGLGISPIETLRTAGEYAVLARKANVLKSFAAMIDDLAALAETSTLLAVFDALLEGSGYKESMERLGDEGITRLENIGELKSYIAKYEQEAPEPSLSGFLEEVALYTDLDSLDDDNDKVVLMTIHSAKGLEFENVLLVGMEEGMFPSFRSIATIDDLEEERRLCYVAITRAKRRLYITNSASRIMYGQTQRNLASRFLKEIPDEYVASEDETSTVSKSIGRPVYSKTGYLQREQAKNRPEVGPRLNFTVGERVSHNVFGDGTILSVMPMANDSMVEIAFDTKGTKKIMANFAKLTKQ